MITASTGKMGEALLALLKGDGPGSTPLLLSAAAGALCCLLLLLLTTAHQKRRGAASTSTSNKPTKPLPTLPGHPMIGNTLEMLNNLPRFLEWLLECTRKPELGGADGLGTQIGACTRYGSIDPLTEPAAWAWALDTRLG